MSAVTKLRRLAEHRERVAKMELATAEQERAAQEQVVAQTTDALERALGAQGTEPFDHLHRHGYALRMEMARRGAEHRLIERQRDVGAKRDVVTRASRERGTLDRLIELQEAAACAAAARIEQSGLDETGLMAWWRRAG
jgi:flagellar export protein FliJ